METRNNGAQNDPQTSKRMKMEKTYTGYTGPFWIFISAITGMPLQVEKLRFKPTVHPYPNGNWYEAHLGTPQKECDPELAADGKCPCGGA